MKAHSRYCPGKTPTVRGSFRWPAPSPRITRALVLQLAVAPPLTAPARVPAHVAPPPWHGSRNRVLPMLGPGPSRLARILDREVRISVKGQPQQARRRYATSA